MDTKIAGSVGVFIPTYNQAQFIGAALDSVFIQSRPPLEILVMNDGSTDHTTVVLTPYAHRIKIVNRPHRGVGPTLQEGLRLFQTDYVVIFNSDDIMTETCLETLASSLDDHPSVGVAYGGMRLVDEVGLPIPHPAWIYPTGLHHRLPALINRNFIPNSAAMFRMAAVQKLGYGRHALCEDWETWITLGIAGWDFFGALECLLLYRRHAQNLTHESRRVAILTSETEMLKQVLTETSSSIGSSVRRAFHRSIGRRYSLLSQEALKNGRYEDARRLHSLAWKSYSLAMTYRGFQTLMKGRVAMWRAYES